MIPQWLAITISALLIVAPFIWMFIAAEHDADAVRGLVIPIIVVVLGLGSLFWSTDDNYYQVRSGTVISHQFSPAHDGFVMVGKVLVPTHYDDDWSIVVRDSNGNEGVFHYSQDPFSYYPVGSHYEAQ
jgi:hypothetical protein